MARKGKRIASGRSVGVFQHGDAEVGFGAGERGWRVVVVLPADVAGSQTPGVFTQSSLTIAAQEGGLVRRR